MWTGTEIREDRELSDSHGVAAVGAAVSNDYADVRTTRVMSQPRLKVAERPKLARANSASSTRCAMARICLAATCANCPASLAAHHHDGAHRLADYEAVQELRNRVSTRLTSEGGSSYEALDAESRRPWKRDR